MCKVRRQGLLVSDNAVCMAVFAAGKENLQLFARSCMPLPLWCSQMQIVADPHHAREQGCAAERGAGPCSFSQPSHQLCSSLGFTFPGLLSGKANSPTMNSIIFLIPKHCVLCFICLVASFLSKCPLREWDTFSSLEFGDEKHSSAPHPVPTAFEERVMFDTERHQWAKPHLTFVVWIQHWNQTKPVFLVFFPFFFFWSEWH